MQERVDYLKLSWFANEIEAADRLRARYEEIWNAYQASAAREPGKLDFNRAYDGKGNWKYTVDISGAAANDIFSSWLNPLTDFQHISRIDYRYELAGSLTDKAHDTIYNNIRALNSRNRNVNRGHARPRDKGPKRDGGGDRVSVGSLISDRYFAVYTKPGENTAVECKFSGKVLLGIKQQALVLGRTKGGTSTQIVAAWYSLLNTAALEHCEKITGHYPDELLSAYPVMGAELVQMEAANTAHHVKSGFLDLPRHEQLSLLSDFAAHVFPDNQVR